MSKDNQLKFLYIVHDVKSREWPAPVVFDNDGYARRALAASVNGDKGTLLSLYPQDFDLWCVGDYNSVTGVVTGYKAPVHVCNAYSLVKVDK